MELVLHICSQNEWEFAKKEGEYRADSLSSEGFIHCSGPMQILGVANSFYANHTDLVILWINPQNLSAELIWEASDGDVFPHLYGPLNLNAVLSVSEFLPDADGVFRSVPQFSG